MKTAFTKSRRYEGHETLLYKEFFRALRVLRVFAMIVYAGTSASTRSGLPLPLTIFSGAAITIAPVGGS